MHGFVSQCTQSLMQYHTKAFGLGESYRNTTLATVGIVRRCVLTPIIAKFLGRVSAQGAAFMARAFAFGCRKYTRFARMSKVFVTPLYTLALVMALIARITVAAGKDTGN